MVVGGKPVFSSSTQMFLYCNNLPPGFGARPTLMHGDMGDCCAVCIYIYIYIYIYVYIYVYPYVYFRLPAPTGHLSPHQKKLNLSKGRSGRG